MSDLYSLIGVSADCSAEDLRRAYKKAALRCHPDRKGGSNEDFQNLQRAYAILNDPYQRKLYDTYGEEMLQIMEGNGGPDVAAKVFARISMAQRAQLVLFFFAATSLLMLTPIFIVLRWDTVIHWHWVACFVPLWVLHMLACVPVVIMPSPPDDMSPEELEEWNAAMVTQRIYRAAAVVVMGLLIALEILVALRLDGSIGWSWHMVLAPWVMLEFVAMVRKLALAGQDGPGSRLPTVGWNVVRLAMAYTVAAKLNGTIDSWDTAFMPFYVAMAVSFLVAVRQCTIPETQEEKAYRLVMGQPSVQEQAFYQMCSTCFLAMWIGLVLWHLDRPDEVSALVVMLPLFLPPYLLCCCLSCFVVFLREDDVAEPAGGSDRSFEESSQVPLNNAQGRV